MARIIVKVSGESSSFRIVIPKELIKEMGWDALDYVVVRKCSNRSLEIRRLFDDEGTERQDR